MIPTPSQVIRTRYYLTAGIRMAGGLMLLFAVWPWGSWMLEGFMDGDLFSYWYYGPRIFMGLIMGIGGLLALALAGLFARLLAPVPDPYVRCPRCQYVLMYAGGGYCPECGLPLDEELMRAARLPLGVPHPSMPPGSHPAMQPPVPPPPAPPPVTPAAAPQPDAPPPQQPTA